VVGGQSLDFDLLGLYLGVFMMRDRTTGSVWAQMDGLASQGPFAGERLPFVPMPQMTWGQWKSDYPSTLVLDNNTGFQSQYGDRFLNQTDPSLASFGDNRLPSNELVVGVEVNGQFAGFPVAEITKAGGVVNTEIGGVPVVVLYDADNQTGIAYKRTVDGQTLTFTNQYPTGFVISDDQSGSLWTSRGTGLIGDFKDAALEFVPSFISEWYGWSAYHPQTSLYAGT